MRFTKAELMQRLRNERSADGIKELRDVYIDTKKINYESAKELVKAYIKDIEQGNDDD